jgi:hypothetical protein
MKALLLLPLFALACTDDTTDLPRDVGALDSGSRDVEPADADPVDADPVDADPTDAGPSDADPIDADPTDADPTDADPRDADPTDADPMDADPPDVDSRDAGDASVECGTLGAACTGSPDCEAPYACQQGTCAPGGRPECGGFVGAVCPPTFPSCLYHTGADFGACFTAAEASCICATPSGQAAFGCP